MQGIFRADELRMSRVSDAPLLCVSEFRGWVSLTTMQGNDHPAVVILSAPGPTERLFEIEDRPNAHTAILECSGRLLVELLGNAVEWRDLEGDAFGMMALDVSGIMLVGKRRRVATVYDPAPISLVTGRELPAAALYERAPQVYPHWRLLREMTVPGRTALIAERLPPAA